MKANRTFLVHLADEHGVALCVLAIPAKIAIAEGDLEAVIRTGGGAIREQKLKRRLTQLRRTPERVVRQQHVPVATAVGEAKCEACLSYLEKFPQVRNRAACAAIEAGPKRRMRKAS